jgi:hypothetical protein
LAGAGDCELESAPLVPASFQKGQVMSSAWIFQDP